MASASLASTLHRPPSTGSWYPGTFDSNCPFGNLNLLCTNLLALHRRPEYVILARSTESAPYASTLQRPPSTGYAIWACSTASASLACILHIVSATVDRITLSEHTQQHLPLWGLESLARELAHVPPSARTCYLGSLNGICLFSFNFTPATADRISYLGMLNGICLFSNFTHVYIYCSGQ